MECGDRFRGQKICLTGSDQPRWSSKVSRTLPTALHVVTTPGRRRILGLKEVHQLSRDPLLSTPVEPPSAVEDVQATVRPAHTKSLPTGEKSAVADWRVRVADWLPGSKHAQFLVLLSSGIEPARAEAQCLCANRPNHTATGVRVAMAAVPYYRDRTIEPSPR
eukprot:scaffold7703_cov63-Phaeocystis_antarctica.AAC.3